MLRCLRLVSGDGFCIGGGNELNLLCDLTIATDRSKFGQAGPRMGSVPIWFGTQLLTLNLGEKRAREIVYLCRQYTAQQAFDMGWVNAVVPPEQLLRVTVVGLPVQREAQIVLNVIVARI